MPFTPLSEGFANNAFANLRLIASDMDGTLTQQGQFTASLLQALQNLSEVRLSVLIVTGRSAGWVSGLAHYLPIEGAIAENGGLFFSHQQAEPEMLVAIPEVRQHRQKLADTFQRLQVHFPNLRESSDNQFRLSDWTFDIQGVSVSEIKAINTYCQDWGWGFTYSNVQGHIKPVEQNKASGLLQILNRYFPDCTPNQVLTVGDSPNDESLFDSSCFPLSVGVANVRHYQDQLRHHPTYITAASEGEGFCELAQQLCRIKSLA